MKFTCSQQTLSKALNIVSKAVTARTTIPILKGILLRIDQQGYLTMAASDLDLSIEKKILVENSQEGEVVVQAKLFGDIIRKLPNKPIEIEEINGNISIKCGGSEFHLISSSAEEFPNLNINEELSEKMLFDKELLKDMIRKTSFAASIDESRGIITGVLMEMKKTSLNLIALDGFRMGISRENCINKDEKNIIIPAKIINEISKIITESDIEEDDIEMYTNEKRAVFIIKDTKIILRLLEGNFIKYNDILPKDYKCKVIANKNDLTESIERASLLAKVGKNNLVKIEIKENMMEITSKSEEGTVREEIMVSVEGEPLIIGFNSKYILDALKVIDDEEISILFNTSVTPCLIKPISGDYYEYLILPVRITNN